MISYLDLFSGAGGLSWGLENAGLKCVGAIEQDRFACETYAANFPKHKIIKSDVASLSESKIQKEFTGLGDAPQVLQRGIESVSTQMTGLSQTTEKIVHAQEELLQQTTALAGQFKYMNEAVDPAKLSQLSESTITSLIELQSKSASINEDFKQVNKISEELRTSEKEATEAVNTFIKSLNQATIYLTDFIRGNPKG